MKKRRPLDPSVEPRPAIPEYGHDRLNVAWIREWLTDKLDVARSTLATGAYDGSAHRGPGNLHPKSPAWRAIQSLAQPLSRDERQDLETVAAVAEEWLAKLDGADANTIQLLDDAMGLTRAEQRLDAAVIFRTQEPDTEDAAHLRRIDAARLAASLKGRDRKVTRKRAEAEVRRIQERARAAGRKPPSFTATCREASRDLKCTGRHLQKLLPKTSAIWQGTSQALPHRQRPRS